MKPRRLTISRIHPEWRGSYLRRRPEPIPLLRLQGRWLHQAGFVIGAAVTVTVGCGELVLTVIHHAERD